MTPHTVKSNIQSLLLKTDCILNNFKREESLQDRVTVPDVTRNRRVKIYLKDQKGKKPAIVWRRSFLAAEGAERG